MKLHDLVPARGAKRPKKRVARGIAAGQGKTGGRGTKGQGARGRGEVSPYLEGGQLPLVRRLPHKRGFTNIFKVVYTPVNLDRLSGFAEGKVVTPYVLAEMGIIKSAAEPVVILGRGKLSRPLIVKAHRFSGTARRKIEEAGGTVEELPL
jgi:large subunit ribosomal protein L15